MQSECLTFPTFESGLDEMANATELTTRVVALEENVRIHIKFFYGAIVLGMAWMIWLTNKTIDTNKTVNRVEQAQANAPGQIVAKILNTNPSSKAEVANNLIAVATVLKSTNKNNAK